MELVADIGGTKMRIAVAEGDSLGEIVKIPTPKTPEEGILEFVKLARDCSKGEHISELVGCIAGDIDDQGILSDAHNLRLWEGTNIVSRLSEELKTQVTMVNDAGLAGLGEASFGAGKGYASIAYITVSTGVGGGFIRDGKIVESGGIASIPIDGVAIEDIISGTAVAKCFGVDPKDFTSVEEREKLADVLARGLKILSDRWSPDVFVVGGSMIAGMNPIPLVRASETLRTICGESKCPDVKMAQLGDNGGLYGGLARLKQLKA